MITLLLFTVGWYLKMTEFNELLESIKRLNATEAEKREVQRIAALERIRELRRAYKEQEERRRENS